MIFNEFEATVYLIKYINARKHLKYIYILLAMMRMVLITKARNLVNYMNHENFKIQFPPP